MPLAILKIKIIFKFSKINFRPPLPGAEIFQKPIIRQKMKIILCGCLIAQMKRFDALITTQKKPQLSARSYFLKNQEKAQKMAFLKNGHFGLFFLIFSKTGLCRALGFFLRCNQCIKTLHLSYQTPRYDDFHFLAYNGSL